MPILTTGKKVEFSFLDLLFCFFVIANDDMSAGGAAIWACA